MRPNRCLCALHTLGYDGAVSPEDLPVVESERKQKISTTWAAGYLKSQLAALAVA